MSIQILENSELGAVFISTGTDWAFGPVMPDAGVAEAFLRSFIRPSDPRLLSDEDLEKTWNDWRTQLLTCPVGHTNTDVTNFSGNETHFYCMVKGCRLVWDQDGNLVQEEEEEEADVLTEGQRLGFDRL